MKLIKYIALFTYLMEEEGLNPIHAYREIMRIRQLPNELKSAVLDILEGKSIPDISYHDVTLKELVEEDQMKPIRAILMLDWIRREPAIAFRYMENRFYRGNQEVTEKDQEMLREVLAKLNARNNDDANQKNRNEEDILIEEEQSNKPG